MEKAPEAFRTISEVADELEVPKHVLRFWEAKFAQLKPMKRGGGRRYYRPEDVALLRGIRFLLYDDGYTIRGVQKILREQGPRFVMDYRGLAEEADDADDDMPRLRDIPDVAAEAAQSGGRARHAPRKLHEDTLDAVLEEIETCQRLLAAADAKD
ncbi:MAG: MerR family transcriptional regulator [Methyloceanibacter sp.]|uniref:MerR family transcriptional regulator n=1 Tax=Methyloceanibacter sp. TaxID=1965321 RepID=UPI003D6D1105